MEEVNLDEKIERMINRSTREPNTRRAKPNQPKQRSSIIQTDDEREEIENLIKGLVPLHPLPPTEEDEDEDLEYGKTQGRIGKSLPKMQISLSTKNKRFLDNESKQRWVAPSAIINALLDVARQELEKSNNQDE